MVGRDVLSPRGAELEPSVSGKRMLGPETGPPLRRRFITRVPLPAPFDRWSKARKDIGAKRLAQAPHGADVGRQVQSLAAWRSGRTTCFCFD